MVLSDFSNFEYKFKTFITSQDKIDYSYLWDLISKKNGLFEIYEEELEEFDADGLNY